MSFAFYREKFESADTFEFFMLLFVNGYEKRVHLSSETLLNNVQQQIASSSIKKKIQQFAQVVQVDELA